MASDALSARRALVAQDMAAASVDAFLISALPNIRYLTGFTGSNAMMLLRRDGRTTLFTDPRYDLQAAEESAAPDCPVRVTKGPLVRAVVAYSRRLHLRKLGFERARLGFQTFAELSDAFGRTPVLVPADSLVERRRMIKSPEEIDLIRRSVMLNSLAFERGLKAVRPGRTTEGDLAAEIEYAMRRLGAQAPAFETIVAAGARAALPHARPAKTKIPPDALLLIDMGASVDGYSSDMTRVVFTGRPQKFHRDLYKAVLEAQLAAVDAVRPGVKAAEVDRVARRVLQRHNLDVLFTHSTGHGLGLEIHESPRLGRTEKTRLETGMTVTIEPGVYLAGECGVRIEDTVVVTSNGCEILTPTPKELRVV